MTCRVLGIPGKETMGRGLYGVIPSVPAENQVASQVQLLSMLLPRSESDCDMIFAPVF